MAYAYRIHPRTLGKVMHAFRSHCYAFILFLCHTLISLSAPTLMCTIGLSISIYRTYFGLSHYLDT